jgi:hypothetical protein
MVWAESRDYYDYNLSKDKSFFRAITDLRPFNDVPPNETPVDIPVKNVKKEFIYFKWPQSNSNW